LSQWFTHIFLNLIILAEKQGELLATQDAGT